MKSPKVAIIHDWLVNYSGAEKVLEQIINIFPEADLFSIVAFLPDNLKGYIKNKKITTSFIQRLPFAKKKYRNYFPLMPMAVEQLDMSEYDIVISSSYSVAKGVITGANQLHVCYCHSPMRYAWDLYHQYLKETGLNKGLKGIIAKWVLHYMRIWDYTSSRRVDYYISNSEYIAKRINKIYHREAKVIYPPVDIGSFTLQNDKEDYYLVASRMVPYKKIDIIVEAFTQLPSKKLIIVGDGPDMKKIQSKAGKNVTIKGHVSFDELKEYMQSAKAFIIAADEDFGITAVEAQACGTPVIAFDRGGVKETVKENKTGIFFKEQTATSIAGAIERFENQADLFSPHQIRESVSLFSINRFKEEFELFVNNCYTKHNENII